MGVRSPDSPKQSQRKQPKAAPRDTSCKVTLIRDGKRSTRNGVAVIEDDELRFHTGKTGRQGQDFALQIPLDEIISVEADAHAGTLTVVTPHDGDLIFHLGRIAPEWKKMLTERPSRLDELGISATSRVAVLGIDDDQLERELAARLPGWTAETAPASGLDFLFLGVEHKADLSQLPALAQRLRRPGGIIWLVHPMVARKVPTSVEINAAARGAGLVPAVIVELSATHQALSLTRV